MQKLKYFDYRKFAQDMKVPEDVLKKIENEIRKRFPDNIMRFELGVCRALDGR